MVILKFQSIRMFLLIVFLLFPCSLAPPFNQKISNLSLHQDINQSQNYENTTSSFVQDSPLPFSAINIQKPPVSTNRINITKRSISNPSTNTSKLSSSVSLDPDAFLESFLASFEEFHHHPEPHHPDQENEARTLKLPDDLRKIPKAQERSDGGNVFSLVIFGYMAKQGVLISKWVGSLLRRKVRQQSPPSSVLDPALVSVPGSVCNPGNRCFLDWISKLCRGKSCISIHGSLVHLFTSTVHKFTKGVSCL